MRPVFVRRQPRSRGPSLRTRASEIQRTGLLLGALAHEQRALCAFSGDLARLLREREQRAPLLSFRFAIGAARAKAPSAQSMAEQRARFQASLRCLPGRRRLFLLCSSMIAARRTPLHAISGQGEQAKGPQSLEPQKNPKKQTLERLSLYFRK